MMFKFRREEVARFSPDGTPYSSLFTNRNYSVHCFHQKLRREVHHRGDTPHLDEEISMSHGLYNRNHQQVYTSC